MAGKQKQIKTKEKDTHSSAPVNAKQFIERLQTYRSAEELKKYHRYFKFDEDKPGSGDRFIGVRMGQVFALAKEFINMPPSEIEKLLESPIHEIQAGGCSIMGKQATRKKHLKIERRNYMICT